uniref:proline-rich protein 2-like n=1 Tax=Euleptes europaea TaxID=460621 RepID=UPI002540C4E0|nr:proline-rich protein 2-like [Euleptes europaea]
MNGNACAAPPPVALGWPAAAAVGAAVRCGAGEVARPSVRPSRRIPAAAAVRGFVRGSPALPCGGGRLGLRGGVGGRGRRSSQGAGEQRKKGGGSAEAHKRRPPGRLRHPLAAQQPAGQQQQPPGPRSAWERSGASPWRRGVRRHAPATPPAAAGARPRPPAGAARAQEPGTSPSDHPPTHPPTPGFAGPASGMLPRAPSPPQRPFPGGLPHPRLAP